MSEEQTGRATSGDGRRWVSRMRDRVKATPASRLVYRVIVALVGLAVVTGGLLLVPLPGPGWLIVLVGLAILASEFTWAQRLLDFVRDRLHAWTRWLIRRPVWVRIVISLVTVGFIGALAYLLLSLRGLPSWLVELVQASPPPG